ncbi:hypothetical protein C9374_005241 [Naegleria lovaniensis]|uniref:PH domain-containing protein n=1 Tax=Naegleria lovaniensis TaxID=51637 RepID=A0AA88GP17_NAELO|nr:uncharacterized protein C9374_005241 [Naegleria lovaniensis]KAG2382661.1 hypothetical protein C9374_005241 [Naegleria lovaniensis]
MEEVNHHQEAQGLTGSSSILLSSSASSTSSTSSTMTPIPEHPVLDESLNIHQEIGEMTVLEALDFLIEENSKLWKEKVKFENYAFALNQSLLESESKMKKLARYKKAFAQEQDEKEKLRMKYEELENELKKVRDEKPKSTISSSQSTDQLQSNLAKMQIQTQQHEKSKQLMAMHVRKVSTKIIEAKLDQRSLKSEAKFMTNKFLDEFASISEQIKNNISMKMDQMENELDKMEKQYLNVLKDSEDQVRETAGFLLKVGQTVKSWKRRWFVFRKDLTFSYFKTIEDLKPIDTIDVSMEDSLDVSADVTQGKPFAFKLVTKDRTYYLCATNEDEKRRWISTLRRWFEVNKAYLTK